MKGISVGRSGVQTTKRTRPHFLSALFFLAIFIIPACCATALLTTGSRPVHADDNPLWERNDKKGIKTARVDFGLKDVVAITCPASMPTAQPILLTHISALQMSLNYQTHYNLRIVINDYRADFGMVAKESSLIFEAKDFNERDNFEGMVQALINAAQNGVDHAEMAVSSLGWRGDLPLTGADQALAGLMDGCGQ
jgi:hypothetical protein